MKSIMEEASSISKAIDQAWNRAGKPAEFSIKILEHPERNMFGLTTKSAKIAFFFDERKVAQAPTVVAAPLHEPKPRPAQQPQRHEEHRPRQQQRQPEQQRPAQQQRQPQAAQRNEQPKPAHEQEQRQPRWNDEMIATAQEWVTNALSLLGKSSITFTTDVSGNGITFRFSESVTGDQGKDRLLFSGFANVIMATLRTKYKKSFRFNKVILLVA